MQQVRAFELRYFGQRRFEELTHHAKSKVALQFSPARTQHAHPSLCCLGPNRREERRLTNSRRPFDHDEPAASRPSLGQRRLDSRQFSSPLEERFADRYQLLNGGSQCLSPTSERYNDHTASDNPGKQISDF